MEIMILTGMSGAGKTVVGLPTGWPAEARAKWSSAPDWLFHTPDTCSNNSSRH